MGYQIRKDAKFRQREDTAADVAWRLRQRSASEQAVAERKAKYPIVTDANFDEASEFQARRMSELMHVCAYCGKAVDASLLCIECAR